MPKLTKVHMKSEAQSAECIIFDFLVKGRVS